MNADEQRGYARGYAAGRRKAKQERIDFAWEEARESLNRRPYA